MSERDDVFTEITNANHAGRVCQQTEQVKPARSNQKLWFNLSRVCSIAIGVAASITAQYLQADNALGVLGAATATFGLALLVHYMDRKAQV